MKTQDELFEFLFQEDEVTWQTILYDLIRSEQMNPWDINISLLSQKFLDMVRQMRGMDFRISGKIILAAAILLKIKSRRLVGEDMLNLDRLINQSDEEDEGLLDELTDDFAGEREVLKGAKLIPRTPQARKRKVSIYDLVDALQKAIEVKKRRVMRDIPSVEIKIPEKKVDVSELMHGVYGKIKGFFAKQNNKKLTFSQLIPSESKKDKIFTFIPLLHLENQRKIDMKQYRHFGEISIEMLMQKTSKEVDKELSIGS
ncbi:segregation/condensation protein A [Candidatus Woesearchaeota archaeon]|nr:segregation/condensation protein A [Candidatus Woesearchaeota archaeon]